MYEINEKRKKENLANAQTGCGGSYPFKGEFRLKGTVISSLLRKQLKRKNIKFEPSLSKKVCKMNLRVLSNDIKSRLIEETKSARFDSKLLHYSLPQSRCYADLEVVMDTYLNFDHQTQPYTCQNNLIDSTPQSRLDQVSYKMQLKCFLLFRKLENSFLFMIQNCSCNTIYT